MSLLKYLFGRSEKRYKCDICSRKNTLSQGYALTTLETLASSSYWEFMARRAPDIFSSHFTLILFIADRASDKTAWFVCEACSGMFQFDKETAKLYASEGGRHPSARALTKEEAKNVMCRALIIAKLPDPSTSLDGIMATKILLEKLKQ